MLNAVRCLPVQALYIGRCLPQDIGHLENRHGLELCDGECHVPERGSGLVPQPLADLLPQAVVVVVGAACQFDSAPVDVSAYGVSQLLGVVVQIHPLSPDLSDLETSRNVCPPAACYQPLDTRTRHRRRLGNQQQQSLEIVAALVEGVDDKVGHAL